MWQLTLGYGSLELSKEDIKSANKPQTADPSSFYSTFQVAPGYEGQQQQHVQTE
jgi:hypothetical protein